MDDGHGQALAQDLGGLYVHCDVGDKTQVDALIARILAAHEHIDMLVNKPEFFGPLIFWM